MKNITFNELSKYLTPYFIEHNINRHSEYDILTINAKDLIHYKRIDLIAKVEYVKHYLAKQHNPFMKELYKAHIEAFSDGNFTELGSEEKNSISKYLESFHQLIDSIVEDGFNQDISLVPVGDDNVILDGAHRVSICTALNKEITIIKFKGLTRQYDLQHFQKHLLPSIYLDYLMLQYVKGDPQVYSFIFWPKGDSDYKDIAIKKIEEHFPILYRKKIALTYNGLKNFMIEIYKNHSWLGDYKNHYQGVYGQLDPCFQKDKVLEVLFVKANGLEDMLKVKSDIRSLYNIGNYSIHSTDNQDETLTVAQLLLNEHSIHFLNYGYHDGYPNFYRNLLLFKERLPESEIEATIIDSSSIMAMYGIRETEDVDYINVHSYVVEGFDLHNAYVSYYQANMEELIYSPKCHFYYNGLKFITLQKLLEFKLKRNETKDQIDAALITKFLKHNRTGFSYEKFQVEWKRFKRNSNLKLRSCAKKTLKALGIYHLYSKIAHRKK